MEKIKEGVIKTPLDISPQIIEELGSSAKFDPDLTNFLLNPLKNKEHENHNYKNN